jgi:hypothetical protein
MKNQEPMLGYIMDSLVSYAHAQSIAASLYHLAHFGFRYDGIMKYRNLEGMCSEWSPMAQRPYQISSMYLQPFSFYTIHTHLWMG